MIEKAGAQNRVVTYHLHVRPNPRAFFDTSGI